MAVLKRQVYRKNAEGTYDQVMYQTMSDVVLRPSGRTVEQDLEDFLPRAEATDNVPESLPFGTLSTNNKRPFIGLPEKVDGVILQSDNPLCYDENGELPPFEGIDADTLDGKDSSEFAAANHNHDGTYAPVSHTHNADQISAGTLSGEIKANTSAVGNLGNAQVRNIYAGTSDIGVGAPLATGDIYLVYE